MGEKEKKKFIIVDNIKPETKDLIYLSILVATFALFFTTFLALNSAEDRCFEHVDTIYNTIEQDQCMSQCLNPILQDTFNYTNLFNGGQEYEKGNQT